jgi:hypothetical protein
LHQDKNNFLTITKQRPNTLNINNLSKLINLKNKYNNNHLKYIYIILQPDATFWLEISNNKTELCVPIP